LLARSTLGQYAAPEFCFALELVRRLGDFAMMDISADESVPCAVNSGLGKTARAVRRAMTVGVVLNIGLVVYGAMRFPSVWRVAPDGICGGIGILIVYGLIGWFGVAATERLSPAILRLALRFGAGVGGMFAISMLCEYVVPHSHEQNVLLAFATFGLFFLTLLVAGAVGTLFTRRLGLGVLTSVWAALIASLCWFILLLVYYFAFLNTPQEARFLEIDQVIADHQRHLQRGGTEDLRTFVYNDYMGGGFFHSLLGPMLAVPHGALGGWAAKVGLWLWRLKEGAGPTMTTNG
jgi:hypothetical protein